MRAGRTLMLAFAGVTAACATPPRPRLATLPAEWQKVRDGAGEIAYHHSGGGAIVSATTCGSGDDVPLHVLTNHLLLGVEERRERARRQLVLDGRAALRTTLDARVDGVPVALDLVVVKKDGCTIDLYLVVPRPLYDARRLDFDRFVDDAMRVSRR